jgi:uncharacterized protein
MNDYNLFEILIKWNYWDRKIEPGLPREITQKIIPYLNSPQVIVLQGVRRSGKSTTMLQIMEALLGGKAQTKDILYINFEEPLFIGQAESSLLERLYIIYRERINPKRFAYIFLDEVQEIKGWEKWIRSKSSLKEAKFFVTGSSSGLLTAEYGTLLTGRHFSFPVYPFSFKEYLQIHGVKDISDPISLAGKKGEIKNRLYDYMQFGGFPEAVLAERSDHRDNLLKQYFEDIIYRDIVWRHNVRDITTLKNIALLYMTNISNLSSYNKLKNTLGAPLDVVRNYSSYLTDAFLIKEVQKHSFKITEQIRNPKKVYAIDGGLRNAVSYRFSEDLGRLAENLVFLSLTQQGKEVFYYKQQGEVDFLIQEGTKIESLIQVCLAGPGEKAWGRELKSLEEAMETLKVKKGLMITEDREEKIALGKKLIIEAIPLWKWLLL